MEKQQANPGGILAPEEVVGRDKLVAQLWQILERRSLYITAERRMGKTCVVRDKMGKATPDGWQLITTVEDGKYRFRSPFILRIWRNRRGIGG